MEAELSRWQLAYETVSTLMSSVASSDTRSTWRPLLLNYPIDVSDVYLPLLGENHEASDGSDHVTPTHFFMHSVGGRVSVLRSAEHTLNPVGNLSNNDSRLRVEIESTLCGGVTYSANETDVINQIGNTEESQNAFANWRTFISSQESSPQDWMNVNPSVPNSFFRHERSHLIRATNEDHRHRHLPNLPPEGSPGRVEVDVISENDVLERVFRVGQNGVVSSNSSNLSSEANSASVQSMMERDINYGRLDRVNVCDLFHRLMKNFYTETFLWIYVNTLLHPGSRRILNRIRFLALETGRSIHQATYDMLSGFLNGYQHSRRPLHSEIDRSLREISVESFRTRYPTEFGVQSAADVERGAHLRQLSLELGAVLNPRQMLRSFGSVVREVTMQTIASPGYQQRGFFQQFHDWSYPTDGQDPFSYPDHSNPQRRYPAYGLPVNLMHPWQMIPPPPPPYPGFLLHFLAMLDQPSVPRDIPDFSDVDVFDTYETLSELTDRLGEAKLSGLSDVDIQRLPVYFYQVTDDHSRKSGSLQETCIICLGRFEKGHRLRVLPCGHDYHDKCVDQWLKIKNTCPVCRSHLEPSTTYQ